jgi:hypothetical protein
MTVELSTKFRCGPKSGFETRNRQSAHDFLTSFSVLFYLYTRRALPRVPRQRNAQFFPPVEDGWLLNPHCG